MCSTTGGQLARICRAIEELASRSAAGGGPAAAADAEPGQAAASEADGVAAGDDVAARLAAIWAMVAEADPELARRLPGYLAAPE